MLKVNVVVVNVLALQPIENVIQTFVGTVGSGEFILSFNFPVSSYLQWE